MRKLLLIGVAIATLVGCSSGIPIPTFQDEQPAIVVSKPPHIPSALPISIRIPEIKSESSLVYTNLNPDGTIETPSVHSPKQASWYEGSPRPGDAGPAIVLGHVDGDGEFGIFHRLRELKIGSQITIDRENGPSISFTVYDVIRVSKDKFPTERVYGNTEASEIRLITCGGLFNRTERSYVDNIVVFGYLN